MTAFMWGVLCGALISPFAFVGLKWCYQKFVAVLNK
jgi:hypothetical protein